MGVFIALFICYLAMQDILPEWLRLGRPKK